METYRYSSIGISNEDVILKEFDDTNGVTDIQSYVVDVFNILLSSAINSIYH